MSKFKSKNANVAADRRKRGVRGDRVPAYWPAGYVGTAVGAGVGMSVGATVGDTDGAGVGTFVTMQVYVT